MKQYGPFLLCGILILALGASSASDKDLIIRLQGEVLVLQKQVRDLQESFDKSSGQTVTLMQKATDNSESTLRTLGSIEEAIKLSQTTQSNSFTGATTRINRLAEQASVNDKRLDQISSQINSLKTLIEQQAQQARQRQEEERKKEATPPRFENPEQLYAFAYTQYTQGKYDEATANFRRYVEAYGSTEAADNAQFWVGEGLFIQMRYAEALVEYDRLLTAYPTGDKVISAHFKKGLTLLYLERREEGVAELRLIINSAPNSTEATQARQELERLGENPNLPVAPKPAKPRTRPN